MAEMKGIDKVIEVLNELPRKARRSAARKATGKGAAIIRKKAKEGALRVDDPDTGRRIADNIGQRFRSRYYRQTGDTMISVGVLSTRGRIPKGNPDEGKRGDTKHWHLVELGTEKARAQPYLRPAASSSVTEVFHAIASEMERQIDIEVDKIGRS